jgi:hypothetical protein
METWRMQRRELDDKLECKLDKDLGKEGRRNGDVENTTAWRFRDEEPRDDGVDGTTAIDDTYTWIAHRCNYQLVL